MSYDFNSKTAACDHAQTFERYVVDAFDFRTLHLAANPAIFMRAPINGASAVQVFIAGQKVTSNHAVYGYALVQDTSRLTEDPNNVFYKIVFTNPVRWYTPLIEINYITRKNYCLKCRGTGFVNDLKAANSGSLVHMVGTDKLTQRCLKFMLTSRCPFYPQFTCAIKDFIGRKFGVQLTESDIASQVSTALDNLKAIQRAQRTVQTLDPLEQLKDISNITATRSQTDPTSVAVAVDVTSYGTSKTVPLGFRLTTVN